MLTFYDMMRVINLDQVTPPQGIDNYKELSTKWFQLVATGRTFLRFTGGQEYST